MGASRTPRPELGDGVAEEPIEGEKRELKPIPETSEENFAEDAVSPSAVTDEGTLAKIVVEKRDASTSREKPITRDERTSVVELEAERRDTSTSRVEEDKPLSSSGEFAGF